MARLRQIETRYRSPGLPAGGLRRLGGLHVHVDGGGSYDLVLEVVREMERRGHPSKLTAITRSIAGPERKQHPETYASHTPSGGEDALEYFSTSAIHDRDDGVLLLRQLLPRFGEHPGTVIEVEHVVATVENGAWSQVGLDEFPRFLDDEIGFKRNASLPFEVHHAFDISRTATRNFDLRQLLSDTSRLGLVVGGWFSFDRGKGDVSFRSNAFRHRSGLREQVLHEQELLGAYLTSKRVEFRRWAIVEQVLGIWHTPLQKILTNQPQAGIPEAPTVTEVEAAVEVRS